MSATDSSYLRDLGYSQNLYRGLNLFTSFAFGSADVGVLVSMVSMFTYGLSTGGSGTMAWGWLIASIMTLIVSFSLAEICSAFPTAGSVYYWSCQLAPHNRGPVSAYWAGVFNWLGNTTGDASFAYTFATLLNAALQVSGSSSLNSGELVAVAIGVLTWWSICNIFRIDHVGWVNNLGVIVQLFAAFFIVGAVLALSPSFNSASDVFFSYNNDTGFSDTGYVLVISMLFSFYSLVGYDGSSHLAEETDDANVNSPLSIIMTVVFSAVVGALLLYSLLASVQDIDDAISASVGNAAIQIVVQTAGNSFAIGAAWLLVSSLLVTGAGSVSVTSRITWAMARDRAMVLHEYVSEVNETTKSPVNAVILVWLAGCLLLLLPLNTDGVTAFYSLVGASTISLQVSYAIPILLKLLGDAAEFKPGPVRLGSLSQPCGLISVLWLFTTAIVFMFPTSSPVTASSMNYAGVIIGGIVIVSYLNWEFFCKDTFTGPAISKSILFQRQKSARLREYGSDHDNSEVRGARSSNTEVKKEPVESDSLIE